MGQTRDIETLGHASAKDQAALARVVNRFKRGDAMYDALVQIQDVCGDRNKKRTDSERLNDIWRIANFAVIEAKEQGSN